MTTSLKDFRINKEYLVCVDSDGCAMDTMDAKHIHCFGPQIVKFYQLQAYQEEFLRYWNHLNLTSITRGINRFKGLVSALSAFKELGYPVESVDVINTWVNTTASLSATALKAVIQENPDPQFLKALSWSKAVDECIEKLGSSDRPFDNVYDTLEQISKFADIVIVSSATTATVMDEWSRHGLLPFVSLIACQEVGPKAMVLKSLSQLSYLPHKRIMIGDAIGDYEAAKQGNFMFYPILAGKESQSWLTLKTTVLEQFLNQNYAAWEEKYVVEFMENFNKK